MKKVRISLKRGAAPWSFTLYDSSESAYYLKDEPPYPDGFEEEYRKTISLKKGETLEIEWIGSEWVYQNEHEDFLTKKIDLGDNRFDKYDNVRVGKFIPAKGVQEKMGYMTVYAGWISGGAVPWYSKESPKTLKIEEINNESEGFDLSSFLKDKDASSQEETGLEKSPVSFLN